MFAARERIDEHGTVLEEWHLGARISPDPLAARQVAALDPQARAKARAHAQPDALAVAAGEGDDMARALAAGVDRGVSAMQEQRLGLRTQAQQPPRDEELRAPVVEPAEEARERARVVDGLHLGKHPAAQLVVDGPAVVGIDEGEIPS